MTFSKTAILLVALALGACTNADRFGPGGAGGAGGGAGSVSDPTSPAYFNQTIGDRVLFAVDQSTLSLEAQSILDGQAQWLANNGDYSAKAMPTSRARANTTSPSARAGPARCRTT